MEHDKRLLERVEQLPAQTAKARDMDGIPSSFSRACLAVILLLAESKGLKPQL